MWDATGFAVWYKVLEQGIFELDWSALEHLGVNPRDWLTDATDRIAQHPVSRTEELLPHRFNKKQDVGKM